MSPKKLLGGLYGNLTGQDLANAINADLPNALSLGFSLSASVAVSTVLAPNTLYTVNTGGEALTAPASTALKSGQVFGVQRGTSTSQIVITAGAGTTINGQSSVKIGTTSIPDAANTGFVWLLATSTTTLIVLTAANTDAGLATYLAGALYTSNLFPRTTIALNRNPKTASYTTLPTDNLVHLTGTTASQTLTLGTSAFVTGTVQIIKNSSNQAWTVAAASGTTDVTTLAAGDGLITMFDGTNWNCIRVIGPVLTATATYDPPSLATTVQDTIQTVTVTGAALGNRVEATFSLDLQGVGLRAWVSMADTVSFVFENFTSGTVDLGSGTVSVWVKQ